MFLNYYTILVSLSLLTNFTCYFIVQRRPDLLTLISFFSITGTIPLLSESFKFVDGYNLNNGYHTYTYSTFILLSFSLAFFSFINFKKRFIFLKFDTTFITLVLLFWFGLLFYIIFKVGFPQIIFSHKSFITQKVGIPFEVFVWLTPFLATIHYSNFKNLSLIFIIILILLVLGDRTAPALIVTGILFIHLLRLPKVSLLTSKKFRFIFILITLSVMCASVSKALYSDFRSGGLQSLDKGYKRRELHSYFSNIELFNTPFILNKIITSNFEIDGYTILSSPLSLSPIPRSLFGDSSSDFGKKMQISIFSDLKFGVGHSFFGEFYATFGFLGIYFGLAIFLILSFLLNFMIFNLKSSYLTLLLMIFGCLFSYYIYRNTLSTMFGFYRFIFYPTISLYLISKLINQVLYKKY